MVSEVAATAQATEEWEITSLSHHTVDDKNNVVDFQWNVLEHWTVVSVSGNCESNGGGGILQIWRMSDLIYRPEDEVLTELDNFKSHVFSLVRCCGLGVVAFCKENGFTYAV